MKIIIFVVSHGQKIIIMELVRDVRMIDAGSRGHNYAVLSAPKGSLRVRNFLIPQIRFDF